MEISDLPTLVAFCNKIEGDKLPALLQRFLQVLEQTYSFRELFLAHKEAPLFLRHFLLKQIGNVADIIKDPFVLLSQFLEHSKSSSKTGPFDLLLLKRFRALLDGTTFEYFIRFYFSCPALWQQYLQKDYFDHLASWLPNVTDLSLLAHEYLRAPKTATSSIRKRASRLLPTWIENTTVEDLGLIALYSELCDSDSLREVFNKHYGILLEERLCQNPSLPELFELHSDCLGGFLARVIGAINKKVSALLHDLSDRRDLNAFSDFRDSLPIPSLSHMVDSAYKETLTKSTDLSFLLNHYSSLKKEDSYCYSAHLRCADLLQQIDAPFKLLTFWVLWNDSLSDAFENTLCSRLGTLLHHINSTEVLRCLYNSTPKELLHVLTYRYAQVLRSQLDTLKFDESYWKKFYINAAAWEQRIFLDVLTRIVDHS